MIKYFNKNFYLNKKKKKIIKLKKKKRKIIGLIVINLYQKNTIKIIINKEEKIDFQKKILIIIIIFL